MANDLNLRDSYALLNAEFIDGDDAFKLLARIARFAADGASESVARDLLIRAHGRRDEFDQFRSILLSLTTKLGLYPYVDDPLGIGTREQFALEFHQPPSITPGFVFHSLQLQVFEKMMAGQNVILSAPTSFGKSAIVDALIASQRWRTVVIIVPTLALIDETRRRLSRFTDKYKVITFPDQAPTEFTLYVMTQERFLDLPATPAVELFVIDEFYKLDGKEETRTALLNIAWDRLRRTGAQYYLIGPSVDRLSEELSTELRADLFVTNFRTVAVDETTVNVDGDGREQLIEICRRVTGPTMIYCQSPRRAREVASWLHEADVGTRHPSTALAAQWISQAYDPEWMLPKCLARGIGLHHGRVPRALQHHMVRHFNSGHLSFLVCTSTLIEGVNTAAENVIIFDGRLSNKRLDYFTFNNIRGRAGRMSRHFVGKVYLFNKSPEPEENIVDIPISSQSGTAPLAAIVQLPEEELTSTSKRRIAEVTSHDALSIETIRNNRGVSPDRQTQLAQELRGRPEHYSRSLSWNGYPTYEERVIACKLILDHLTEAGQRGRVNDRSLATRLGHASRYAGDIPTLIAQQLRFSGGDHDDATEDVLFFLRNWLGHLMPAMLSVLENIQREVFADLGLPHGSYGFYASQVESLFLPPYHAALEEYGLPISVSAKLAPFGLRGDSLDEVLASLRIVAMDLRVGLTLHPYEVEMLNDVVVGLGVPTTA